MENSKLQAEYVDEHGELVRELPREEVLARLYELLARYEEAVGIRHHPCPFSRERASQGLGEVHAFGFGCCRPRVVDELDAAA